MQGTRTQLMVCRTPEEMRAACRELRRGAADGRAREPVLGLVPTMGALHAGHLSLVSAARVECDAAVASIFVNPSQFAPGEDYEAYPRDFEADCAKLEAAGVELVFAPAAEAMYPLGTSTWVEVAGIGDRLDGASRPGHFRGVATIVARLFNIVEPDRAYFGQKDAAQVAVIRRMVRDLNMGVEVRVCPIVREADGLAMSSRNRYLTKEERGRALILRRALDAAQRLVRQGETRAERLRAAMLACFFDFAEPDDQKLRLDYAEVMDPETLEPVVDTSQGALVAVAAWVGKTRLIDNFVIEAHR
jgi:pantoate--beta-alanine ligase